METGQPAFLTDFTENENKISITDNGQKIIYGSFWTNKQRQASSLHEISYRACFKPQLPRFFLLKYSVPRSVVLDPFSGRGTTAIESALLERIPISNDTNPISKILTEPRLRPPTLKEVSDRLDTIPFDKSQKADIDLSMFYHADTEGEIVSLRNYLLSKHDNMDYVDKWIRMVATNRLTGHSKNFFSVYTLPPNQAASQEEQKRINERLNQVPQYKNVKQIILKKTEDLLRDVTPSIRERLFKISRSAIFLEQDSRNLSGLPDNYVDLIITSPPFINLVSYAKDNWLRLWFNGFSVKEIEGKITVLRNISDWSIFVRDTLRELRRVLKAGGYLAFEVGETRQYDLKDIVYDAGVSVGFEHIITYINVQKFTKTSNIWGVENNKKGTNTNRIVLLTV